MMITDHNMTLELLKLLKLIFVWLFFENSYSYSNPIFNSAYFTVNYFELWCIYSFEQITLQRININIEISIGIFINVIKVGIVIFILQLFE